jgi:hypothetical protein
VSLAEQLHEALVASVATLSGLERAGMAEPLLASLAEPRTTCNWMESCVRECSHMHALGYFLGRPAQAAQVPPARKRC